MLLTAALAAVLGLSSGSPAVAAPADYGCKEWDKGLDYVKASSVAYFGYIFEDRCVPAGDGAGKWDLLEYSCYDADGFQRCRGVSCAYTRYRCPGDCKKGACVSVVKDYGCKDTDGGLNFRKPGSVSYAGFSFTDSCARPGVVNTGSGVEEFAAGDLLEYACNDEKGGQRCLEKTCLYTKYHCPGGCEGGRCVGAEGESCADSDGGIAGKKQGSVRWTDEEGLLRHREDECKGETSVIEYFCAKSGRGQRKTVISCPNGCKDGACL